MADQALHGLPPRSATGLELLEVRRTDPGVPHEFDFVAFTSVAARRVIVDRVRALASL